MTDPTISQVGNDSHLFGLSQCFLPLLRVAKVRNFASIKFRTFVLKSLDPTFEQDIASVRQASVSIFGAVN